MLIHRTIVLAAFLLIGGVALADDAPQPPPALSDVVYKGVVGKVLDGVPMDPEGRVALQRTSAVVSGTLAGRSLATWAGISNPILLVAGLVWGLFSASNITTAESGAIPDTHRVAPPAPRDPGQLRLSLVAGPPAPPSPEGAR